MPENVPTTWQTWSSLSSCKPMRNAKSSWTRSLEPAIQSIDNLYSGLLQSWPAIAVLGLGCKRNIHLSYNPSFWLIIRPSPCTTHQGNSMALQLLTARKVPLECVFVLSESLHQTEDGQSQHTASSSCVWCRSATGILQCWKSALLWNLSQWLVAHFPLSCSLIWGPRWSVHTASKANLCYNDIS